MKLLVTVNILAMLVFAGIAVVMPFDAELGIRGRFTQLDRSGAINADALAKFHPSYHLTENIRANVPDYIAGDAVDSIRTIAWLAAGVAFFNLFVIYGNWQIARLCKSTPVGDEVSRMPAESGG